MSNVAPTMSAVSAIQGMADQTTNRRLGIVLTVASSTLVCVMLIREVGHAFDELMRIHDRRSRWPGDQRGMERDGGHPDPYPRRMG